MRPLLALIALSTNVACGLATSNDPLIGKYAGDQVEVQAPGGVRRYEILDVRYE